jgi:hypothetical protein
VSYDLQVWARTELDDDELGELVRAAGLSPGDDGTVRRGARDRYCFHLQRSEVELEDLPDEVVATVLAPTTLYDVRVEGTAASEIPYATKFARRLARAAQGAVLDQQGGTVWSAGKLREAPRVQDARIDLVSVHWYVTQGDRRHDARAWLDAARRHLPEALPRRYGQDEPLSEKYDRAAPEAFVAAAGEATSSVLVKGSRPCLDGAIAASEDGWPVSAHSLSVQRVALHDPGWLASFRRFFVDVADTTGALYAAAEVVRGVVWNGRTVWYDGQEEPAAYLAARGVWAGPPPYPVWWSWFGPEYAPLVEPHLPADGVERVGGALFHRAAEEPADRDAIGAHPLPPQLLARDRQVEGAVGIVVAPAEMRPEAYK